MKVGVLALQGDVPEHLRAVGELLPAGSVVPVTSADHLGSVDALLLPGGESTTIAALIKKNGLWEPLKERVIAGLPLLATCAGLILLARELEPSESGRNPPTLGMLDVKVRRNDYGAQRESFEGPVRVNGMTGAPFPGVFIRAPRILSVGRRAEPIAYHDDEVVGVRSGAIWGLTFHPELSHDRRLHEQFLRQVGGGR